MKPRKISITRTYNRFENISIILEKCSSYFDQMIIVDSGSTDATKHLCDQYDNVMFIPVPWKKRYRSMLSELFQYGLDQCQTGDYVLSLDSDEVPEEEFLINMDSIIDHMETNGFDRAKLFSLVCIDGKFDEQHRRINLELISKITYPNEKDCCIPFGRTMFFKYDPESVVADVAGGVHGQFFFKKHGDTYYLPYFFYHMKSAKTLCESNVYSFAEWGKEYCSAVSQEDVDEYNRLSEEYGFENFRDFFSYLKKGKVSKDWVSFIIRGSNKDRKGYFYDFTQSLYALYFHFLHPEESEKDLGYFAEFSIDGNMNCRLPLFRPERIDKARFKNVNGEIESKVRDLLGIDEPGRQFFIQIEEEWDRFVHYFFESGIRVNTALEIGSFYGGGLLGLNYLAEEGAQIISIDNDCYKAFETTDDQRRFFESIIDKDKDFKILRLDSKSEKCLLQVKFILGDEKLDYLFIDGGHDYQSVKNDFDIYSPLVSESGIIVFHDIGGEIADVCRFWKEIKEKHDTTCEFISGQFPTGIGVVLPKSIRAEKNMKDIDQSNVCICCCNASCPNNDVLMDNFLHYYCANLSDTSKSIPLYISCDGDYDNQGFPRDEDNMYNKGFADLCERIGKHFGLNIRITRNHEPMSHYRLMDDFIYREIREKYDWVIFIDFDMFVKDPTWIDDYLKIINDHDDLSAFGAMHGNYFEKGINSHIAPKLSTQLLGIRVEDFVSLNTSLRGLGCDGFDFREKQISPKGTHLFCDTATFFLFDLLRANKKIYFCESDENKKFEHLGAVTNKCNPRSPHYDNDLVERLKKISFFDRFGGYSPEPFPEDYVLSEQRSSAAPPAKKPIKTSDSPLPSNTHLKIGAFYYMWYYKQGWTNLTARSRLKNRQVPLLGEYDSLDEDVIERHIEWGTKSGIDFFVVCVDQDCVSSGRLNRFLDVYESVSLKKEKFPKIAIQIESLSFFDNPMNFTVTDKGVIKQKLEWLKISLRRNIWYHIEGKPALFFYVTRNIKSGCDIFADSIREMFDMPIHLAGDEVWHDEMRTENNHCFDSLYPYNLYLHKTSIDGFNNKDGKIGTDYIRATNESLDKYYEFCKEHDIMLMPNVLPRYNDRGVRYDKDHYVIPESNGEFFKQYLEDSSQYMLGNHLLVTSWNEWYEDTQIEPCGDSENYGMIETESDGDQDITQGYEHRVYGEDFLEILRDFKGKFGGSVPPTTRIPKADSPSESKIEHQVPPSPGGVIKTFNAYQACTHKFGMSDIKCMIDAESKMLEIEDCFGEMLLQMDFASFDNGRSYVIRVCDNGVYTNVPIGDAATVVKCTYRPSIKNSTLEGVDILIKAGDVDFEKHIDCEIDLDTISHVS